MHLFRHTQSQLEKFEMLQLRKILSELHQGNVELLHLECVNGKLLSLKVHLVTIFDLKSKVDSQELQY